MLRSGYDAVLESSSSPINQGGYLYRDSEPGAKRCWWDFGGPPFIGQQNLPEGVRAQEVTIRTDVASGERVPDLLYMT